MKEYQKKCSSNCWPKKPTLLKIISKIVLSQLIIVANIGPTMATFKFYDLNEEDSLTLHITLSNLGDIDEQIHQLWQQVNFLLQQYCSQCQCHYTKENIIVYFLLRKVYVYAFCLKQGGVMQPHILNILYGYKT